MKKIIRSFLFVFILFLAIALVGCKKNEEENNGGDNKPEEHVHSYTSYFHKEVCEGCGKKGTLESERLYDEEVVYKYSDADYQKFQSDYQKVLDEVNKVGKYDAAKDVYVQDSEAYKAEDKFEKDFYDVFDEDCNYILECIEALKNK